MKYYLLFDANYNFLGYTNSKEVIDTFKKQRQSEWFKVEKINSDKDLRKLGIREEDELMVIRGIVITYSEYEMFMESYDQMLTDMKKDMGEILKKSMEYIKFTDEEREIIVRFASIFYELFHTIENEEPEQEVEIVPFENFFYLEKLIERVI